METPTCSHADSAMSRALALWEIRENIYIQLLDSIAKEEKSWLRREHFTWTITTMPLISKSWSNLVAESPTIQRMLFLVPQHSPEAPPQSGIFFNPVFFRRRLEYKKPTKSLAGQLYFQYEALVLQSMSQKVRTPPPGCNLPVSKIIER
jgi:hypothetical protein